MTINELITKAHGAAKAKGFWDKERNKGELLMLIVSECGEALEAHRKGKVMSITPIQPIGIPVSREQATWKQCVEHKDYEVNEFGEVRSKDMWVDNGNGGHTKKGRVLRPGIGGTGYRTVSLRGKTYKVARLVASAFLDRPAGTSVINHIDGNKTNDIAWNLEWVTAKENNEHALREGLRNPHKVFNWEDRAAVLTDLSTMRLVDVADKWNVSPSAIKNIKNDYGDLFSYFEYELADIVIRIADFAGGEGWTSLPMRNMMAEDGANVGELLFAITICLAQSRYEVPGDQFVSAYALGDACSLVFGLARSMNINLWRHIELKMQYNETRERLHGKAY